MTWPEIVAEWPDQWVVICDLDFDEVTLEVRSGVVRGHSQRSREAYSAAAVCEGELYAHFFTGKIRNPRLWLTSPSIPPST